LPGIISGSFYPSVDAHCLAVLDLRNGVLRPPTASEYFDGNGPRVISQGKRVGACAPTAILVTRSVLDPADFRNNAVEMDNTKMILGRMLKNRSDVNRLSRQHNGGH